MERYFSDFHYHTVENMGYDVPTAQFANSSSTPNAVSHIASWLFWRFPAADEPDGVIYANTDRLNHFDFAHDGTNAIGLPQSPIRKIANDVTDHLQHFDFANAIGM